MNTNMLLMLCGSASMCGSHYARNAISVFIVVWKRFPVAAGSAAAPYQLYGLVEALPQGQKGRMI